MFTVFGWIGGMILGGGSVMLVISYMNSSRDKRARAWGEIAWHLYVKAYVYKQEGGDWRTVYRQYVVHNWKYPYRGKMYIHYINLANMVAELPDMDPVSYDVINAVGQLHYFKS